jgi:RNA polymerase sigma-70 factor (ECF subfamily)
VKGLQAVGEVLGTGPHGGQLDVFLRASNDVHRYISRLTGGDRQLTEDIVQETFIAMLRHQRSHPDVEVGVGWLMTAARNRLIDQVRSRQRDEARVERHSATELRQAPPVDAAAVSDDQARWMLAQLPVYERVALGLHVVDGLSIAEVADQLGRTVEATSSLLARARRHLRSLALEMSDG